METAWPLGQAIGINLFPPEPRNPASAKMCVNLPQNSKKQEDIRRCSGRNFSAALRLPARRCWHDLKPRHVAGTCGYVISGIGKNGGSPAAQLLQDDLPSSQNFTASWADWRG